MLYYKSKTLSDGSHPLMLCVYKDGKRKYRSLGISILPQFWDSKKNRLRKNCPNWETIQSLISEKIKEYSDQSIEFKRTQKELTASKLIERVDCSVLKITQIYLDSIENSQVDEAMKNLL